MRREPSHLSENKVLPYCFSSHTVYIRVLFADLNLVPCFSHYVLSVHDSAISNGPKYSTEVLRSVPKHKKTAISHMEKLHVLKKLHSGWSFTVLLALS